MIKNNLIRKSLNYLDGDKVIYEFSGSDTIRYTYDLDGSIISMNLNGTEYFYIKDLQGSITDIVDKDGNKLVSYEYDAYGNIFNIADSSGIDLGHINPYRYDEETGWYYLNSRYYSPQWGRFISEDGQINNGVLGTNMYDYSVNNPVNYKDPGGNECYFAQGDIETGWAKEGECGGRFGKNLDAKTINDVSNTGINSGKGTVNPSASFANSYGVYTVGTEQTRVPNDFKRAGNTVHGNSKLSTKTQHGYEIYENSTGKVVKVGISGRPLNLNGTSPRANSQVNAWNKAAGYDQYGARVVEFNIQGRQAALQWEIDYVNYMRSINQPMNRHNRP